MAAMPPSQTPEQQGAADHRQRVEVAVACGLLWVVLWGGYRTFISPPTVTKVLMRGCLQYGSFVSVESRFRNQYGHDLALVYERGGRRWAWTLGQCEDVPKGLELRVAPNPAGELSNCAMLWVDLDGQVLATLDLATLDYNLRIDPGEPDHPFVWHVPRDTGLKEQLKTWYDATHCSWMGDGLARGTLAPGATPTGGQVVAGSYLGPYVP